MFNTLSFLGACALVAFSTPSNIQNETETTAVEPIYYNSNGYSIVKYENEYYFNTNFQDHSGFNSWWYNTGSYVLNHFFNVVWFDNVDNEFKAYGTFSNNSSNYLSFSDALADSLTHVTNCDFGMLFYFQYSNTNPNIIWSTMGVIGGISNVNTYVGDTEWTNLYNYGLLNNELRNMIISPAPSRFNNVSYINYGTVNDYFKGNFSITRFSHEFMTSNGTYPYAFFNDMVSYVSLSKNDFLDHVRNRTLKFDFLVKEDSNYQNGYNVGYQNGVNTGYQNGYSQGFADADNQDSTALTIFTGIINVALLPVNVFLLMLNFEVFGINIGGLVSSFLTVAIVLILWRIISGNKND